MIDILENKKKLVLTLAVISIMIMTTIPTVIAPPPEEKPLRDFDWNFWQNMPHMYSMNPGNVGIGTPKPGEKLTLGPNNNFAVEMSQPQNVVASGDFIDGGLPDGTYYFRIAASDGIGTTIPTLEVNYHVNGITEDMIRLNWDPVQGAEYYIVYKGAEPDEEDRYITCNVPMYEYSTDSGFTPFSGPLPKETTAFVNKISADDDSWFNSGFVGIGTTTPEALLDVFGVLQVRSDNALGHFQLNREDVGQVWTQKIRNDGSFVLYDQTNDLSPIVVEKDSADNAIYIEDNGYVGLGTLDPAYKLDVQGNMRSTNSVFTGGNYKYSDDQTGYLSIPACAFTPMSLKDDDYWYSYAYYGYIEDGSGTYDVRLSTPLYLPDGAELEKLTVYYYDNDPAGSADFSLKLQMTRLGYTAVNGLVNVDVETIGAVDDIRSEYELYTGNNPIYMWDQYYFLTLLWEQTNLGDSVQFCGCQIKYTIDEVPI